MKVQSKWQKEHINFSTDCLIFQKFTTGSIRELRHKLAGIDAMPGISRLAYSIDMSWYNITER